MKRRHCSSSNNYAVILISSFFTDIFVPKEFDAVIDDEEDADEMIVKEDTWNDLGVDFFFNDGNQFNGAVNSIQPVTPNLHQPQSTLSQT